MRRPHHYHSILHFLVRIAALRVTVVVSFSTAPNVSDGRTIPSTCAEELFHTSTEVLPVSGLTLVPVCRKPIILESSKPLLTSLECRQILDFFEDGDFHFDTAGGQALERVKLKIDELVGCPSDHGEFPLFIDYDPVDVYGPSCQQVDSLAAKELLPNGLHVDANNAENVRYVTCILYLTTNLNQGGATIFPLANVDGATSFRPETKSAIDAAKTLLLSGTMHTSENNGIDEIALEQAALDHYNGVSDVGYRVIPETGKLVVFCNVGPDGSPDPLAFHSGEGLLKEPKYLLTFFKNVPTLEDFDDQANKVRETLIENYFSEQLSDSFLLGTEVRREHTKLHF